MKEFAKFGGRLRPSIWQARRKEVLLMLLGNFFLMLLVELQRSNRPLYCIGLIVTSPSTILMAKPHEPFELYLSLMTTAQIAATALHNTSSGHLGRFCCLLGHDGLAQCLGTSKRSNQINCITQARYRLAWCSASGKSRDGCDWSLTQRPWFCQDHMATRPGTRNSQPRVSRLLFSTPQQLKTAHFPST